MPKVQFAAFPSPSDSSFFEDELCPACKAAHKSIETVKEIMKVLAYRKNIRGHDLRTLVRAASDILHTISYPQKEDACTCNSLN